MFTYLYLFYKGPFLSPERRLLLWWALRRHSPTEASLLINEDLDYIVFGEDTRIIVSRS